MITSVRFLLSRDFSACSDPLLDTAYELAFHLFLPRSF